MKLHFKTQQFQKDAVDAVVSVFSGQIKQEGFRYRRDVGKTNKLQSELALSAANEEIDEPEAGYRNADLSLTEQELLSNIRDLQKRSNLKVSDKLDRSLGAVSLDVEMETGTGKTYVYIRTMFELHKQYGWSKFIVVVPSVAIREGVKKTFEVTQEHFMEAYGKKARFFIYDSSNLHQLDEFSQSSGINVMIINTQAFAASLKEDGRSKEARIIYSKRDEFASRRPIDVISANRPIIILDEPQKMGGAKTQEALRKNFRPLFSLNYSATHKVSHNLVYVLDALDAFKKQLVKKIEVKGFEIKNLQGTDCYLYLSEIVVDRRKAPCARLEFEVKHKGGIKREVHLLEVGDSLFVASNHLEQYKGLIIAEVDPLRSQVTFSNGIALAAGEAAGNTNESDIRRVQIRETISSHFEKEAKLFESGIKCLSLFFIDEVAKYRQYDDNGCEQLGEYGKVFEEEYKAVFNERQDLFPPEYRAYVLGIQTGQTHRGYFSIDKKTGHPVDSSVRRGSDSSDDISAYDLILKNKERLLSLEEPTRFIFSHSALREGWDNPNVFQICTLKHSDNTTAKRQEVGRGLRLCVDKQGDRQDAEACGEERVHDINKLTVIASESYTDFVKGLQEEIREDLYERPSKATKEFFTGKRVVDDKGNSVVIDEKMARLIYQYLVKHDYVDEEDNISAPYHEAEEDETFAPMPEAIAPCATAIHSLIKSIFDVRELAGMVEDARETSLKENRLTENFHKKEFIDLWNKISKRYAYVVDFDSTELIENSVGVLNAKLNVATLKYVVTKGEQEGADFGVTGSKTQSLKNAHDSAVKYDLVGKIAEGTTLTRRSVMSLLRKLSPTKLALFRLNPEEFIKKVVDEINQQKAAIVIEHISYQPSSEPPFAASIFNMSKTSQEYARAFRAKKAIQEYVFTDGTAQKSVERQFAEEMDVADEVVVYAKLPSGPRGFYIPTPVGNYSPDWAIAFKKGTVKHVFFIAETKGSLNSLDLRPIEKAKITCAQKLFNDISTEGVRYGAVRSYQDMLDLLKN